MKFFLLILSTFSKVHKKWWWKHSYYLLSNLNVLQSILKVLHKLNWLQNFGSVILQVTYWWSCNSLQLTSLLASQGCVCVTCQAIGQCVSMINCDISQCDVPGLQPVRAIVTAPHSHSTFELLLCCSNERMFFSTPNPRELVWVCVCSMVSHNVLLPLSLYSLTRWPVTRGLVVFLSL